MNLKELSESQVFDLLKSSSRLTFKQLSEVSHLHESNVDVITAACRQDNVPEEILEKYVDSEYWSILISIAKNPVTPIRLLNELSRSDVTIVRSSLASNVAAPLGLLERMTKDPERTVQLSAFQNINAPYELVKNCYLMKELYYNEVSRFFKNHEKGLYLTYWDSENGHHTNFTGTLEDLSSLINLTLQK